MLGIDLIEFKRLGFIDCAYGSIGILLERVEVQIKSRVCENFGDRGFNLI